MEFRPIRVRGKFLHDKELVMGPRTFIDGKQEQQKSNLITQQGSSSGYLIITPFKLEGREYVQIE